MPDALRNLLPIAAACLAAPPLAGCVEERIVAVRGGLASIPGAEGYKAELAQRPTTADTFESTLERYHPLGKDYEPIEDEPLRYRSIYDDSDVVLLARSPQHLIYHLAETLRREEKDLLFEQVIADAAKLNYHHAWKEPREAADYLLENREQVIALLSFMPAAQYSPGVRMKKIGPKSFRLTPSIAREDLSLRFGTLDLIIEEGNFRLLMIE